MIDYDMHIHTVYCGHAPGMHVEAIVRQAEKKQLETIALTCHVFSDSDLAVIERIKQKLAAIKTDVNVIVGAEVDVDGMRTDGRLVTDKLKDISYVVGSIHYIPGTGILPYTPDDNPLGNEEFFDRWTSTLLGLVSNPVIDTLAHPGRVIAMACDVDIFFDDVLAVFQQAAELSAQNNIAWEINELNGSKVPAKYHGRWHEIFLAAVDAKVKLVYGSDAHSIDEIGKRDFTNKMLSRLGENCLESPASLGIINR